MTKRELKNMQRLRRTVHRKYKTKKEFDAAFDEGWNRASKPMSPWLFFGVLALGALVIAILTS